jgi:hypothetical protein
MTSAMSCVKRNENHFILYIDCRNIRWMVMQRSLRKTNGTRKGMNDETNGKVWPIPSLSTGFAYNANFDPSLCIVTIDVSAEITHCELEKQRKNSLIHSAEITNKMQPYNRIYYSTVHWRLNMFRAAYRSSLGALTVFAASGLHTHVAISRSQVWVGTQ